MQRWTGIGLALLLLGALRIGYAQALGRAEVREPPIDARYGGLKIALRPIDLAQPIFFQGAGREDPEAQRLLAQASYALSPRVLLPDRGGDGLVILEVAGAELSADRLRELRLEELWRSEDGRLVLARRSAAP